MTGVGCYVSATTYNLLSLGLLFVHQIFFAEVVPAKEVGMTTVASISTASVCLCTRSFDVLGWTRCACDSFARCGGARLVKQPTRNAQSTHLPTTRTHSEECVRERTPRNMAWPSQQVVGVTSEREPNGQPGDCTWILRNAW